MRSLLLALLVFISVPAFSQAAVAPVAPTVDVAHQATAEQVRDYFAVIRLDETLKKLVAQMVSAMKSTGAPYIPESVWQDMGTSLGEFDFLSTLVPVYQAHLSREDLKSILAFYHSEAGEHLLANQNVMSLEAQNAFRAKGQLLGEEVAGRHADEIVAAKKKYDDDIVSKQRQKPTPKAK